MATPDCDLPANATVAEVGEQAIIDWIRRVAPPAPPEIVTGIGDDAAVLDRVQNHLAVVTTDSLVEEVHFRRPWSTPSDVGAKALLVNLSDLAAMGATPHAALLSLGLPATLSVAALVALVAAFIDVARANRMGLVGGNISLSPGPLFVDVTAIGAAKRRKLLYRHGARVGDSLYVTGSLGGAAAGLLWLQRTSALERTDSWLAGVESPFAPAEGRAGLQAEPLTHLEPAVAPALQRYFRPDVRSRIGQSVGRARAARACVDLSDGLADALRQMASASGIGVEIDAEAIPVDASAREVASRLGADPLTLALSGGEDYELLFAVSQRSTRRFLATVAGAGRVPVTRIGRVLPPVVLDLVRNGRTEQLPGGFRHFADASSELLPTAHRGRGWGRPGLLPAL
ncbi:MAG: thiamine-phosphate kinase [Luteitalea sp.]|nr:thiamine-phosphate kinase [Luteitalea sp.]